MVTILQWRRGVALFALVCGLALWAAPASARQALAGHVPAAARRLAPLGQLEDTHRLHLAISLPLRNADQLKQLVDDLYNPRSTHFRRYLTADEFAQRFGPTAADYAAVKAFMEKSGFTITATHPNRAVLDVAGPVKAVHAALHTRLRKYRHPTEDREFFAPDSEPSLELATRILSIAGLDNFDRPKPLAQRTLPSPAGITPNAGSGAGGMYQGTDFRKIYAPGVTLTGAGQVVALVQWDGYFTNDIAKYCQATGIDPVPLEVVLVDGFDGAPGGLNFEVALDIQMTMAMAPGLEKIVVYETSITNTQVASLLNRIATDNTASQISCSWSWTKRDASIDQIFLQMAAQGQSFFTASGDSGAYADNVHSPVDHPYVTVVGGTTVTTGSLVEWQSEKVWNNDANASSSGGFGTNYALPSWQSGINLSANGGSTRFRNLPDVAMIASKVLTVADNGTSYTIEGTSIASPLWAAFTALINEQADANGQGRIGFLNPALYALGKSSKTLKAFHDVTTNGNYSAFSPDKYYATAGYDLCTGWGTPTGSNTINLLLQIANEQADHFSFAASTNAPTTNLPFTVTLTAQSLSDTADATFNGTVQLTAAQVQTNVLFGRDFETGTFLDWSNEGGPFACSIDSATGAAGTTRCLSLSGGDGSNSFNGLSHSLPALRPEWFEFYVKATTATNTGGYVAAGRGKYPTNLVFNFHLGPTGAMGLYDASANWYPAPYVANQWYKIGLQLDWTNKVVHYYVDDALVFANIPFCNPKLTNLLVMNLYNLDNTQSWYDQFRLTLPTNTTVTLTPTEPVEFTNGVWQGPVTVGALGTNIILTANDSAGHAGASAPLNLQTPPLVTVTVDASPAGAGSTTGGGNLVSTSQQTIQALPAAGWGFVQWQDTNTQNPRTITVPTTNATYTAIFLQLPEITSQPASQIVNPGTNATFAVTATGPAPICYYWQRNGLALGGATNTYVVVTNITAADSGALFACLASNRAGAVASQSARLSVRPVLIAPGMQLANQTLTLPLSGTPGSNYTLQTSTDFTNWTALANLKLVTEQTNYLDTNSASPWRFYRLLGTP